MGETEVVVASGVSRARAAAGALSLVLLAATSARAGGLWQASGSRIDMSVEVDGGAVPLYPARDGSGRYYLEAHAGSAYALRIVNRCSERIGVVVAVDGLNAISGEREPGPAAASRPGRMYVIDPWDEVRVRGWRTSLQDVRQFTFVDERVSYAARTGRANGKMGWIQAWAYRERATARISPPRVQPWDRPSGTDEAPEARNRDDGKMAQTPRPEDNEAVPRAAAPPAKTDKDAREEQIAGSGGAPVDRAQSYPGTGWGSSAADPATIVTFLPDPRPADVVTLRYEYASALHALGIVPRVPDRDRLRERERGDGFARSPAW